MACPDIDGDDIDPDATEAFMKPAGSSVYDAYEALFTSALPRATCTKCCCWPITGGCWTSTPVPL
ncbi:hypothetical protein AB0N06_07070 [Streptomyces sp. NPDC051020]|uniref:hypothetical protein n=1 Tax=Streptomyces sp. NPDC051020 TaxID=3155409 RepID=UPI00343F6FC1